LTVDRHFENMTPMNLIKSFLVLFALSASLYATPNRDRVLKAIVQVESRGDYSKFGAGGEAGIYQIAPKTWAQYSSQSIKVASTKAGQVESERVAKAHYDMIVVFFKKKNIEVNVYNIALAWNAGVGRVSRDDLASRHRSYAKRVNSLYNN
jgi:hypothetical protein